jgi:hypothetical protein
MSNDERDEELGAPRSFHDVEVFIIIERAVQGASRRYHVLDTTFYLLA